MGAALDAPVDAPHGGHRRLHLGHGAVGRGDDVRRCPRQATQRIGPVVRVVGDPGHDLGVGRLDEESADPGDEARDVGHDLPGDRVGTEEPGIARVVERVGHGIVGVREEAHGAADDGAPEALEWRRGHDRCQPGLIPDAVGVVPAMNGAPPAARPPCALRPCRSRRAPRSCAASRGAACPRGGASRAPEAQPRGRPPHRCAPRTRGTSGPRSRCRSASSSSCRAGSARCCCSRSATKSSATARRSTDRVDVPEDAVAVRAHARLVPALARGWRPWLRSSRRRWT